MALRRITADDNYKAGVLNVPDRPGITTITDRAKEAFSRRRLAVAGAIILERVRPIRFVRLGLKRNFLMLHCEHFCRVVDRAIPVVIVADRAVEHMVAENSVERLPLCGVGSWGLGDNIHACRNSGRACSYELSVDLDHTGIARLNRAELGMIANVGNFGASSHKE